MKLDHVYNIQTLLMEHGQKKSSFWLLGNKASDYLFVYCCHMT